MHMADALLSPSVGGTLWIAAAGGLFYCSKKISHTAENRKIPLMGVLGAFIFAAQMINFTIPGTGSSGHIGGGLLLAVLLGPQAAFLVMASIVSIQAMFFADGGLLALGCNIINLGFFPCFVAYPLVYKTIVGARPTTKKITLGALAASVLALQLGALAVVLETVFSGVAELPFVSFIAVMLPIHLAIGIAEGLITAAILGFILMAEPLLLTTPERSTTYGFPFKTIATLLVVTLFSAGILSWYASDHPDGLEWSIRKITGTTELESPETLIHHSASDISKKVAFFPDYTLGTAKKKPGAFPEKAGASLAGITGALACLALISLITWILRRKTATGQPHGKN